MTLVTRSLVLNINLLLRQYLTYLTCLEFLEILMHFCNILHFQTFWCEVKLST